MSALKRDRGSERAFPRFQLMAARCGDVCREWWQWLLAEMEDGMILSCPTPSNISTIENWTCSSRRLCKKRSGAAQILAQRSGKHT
jgi:hypothetical protein